VTGQVCVVGSFMMDLAACAPRRPAAGETVLGTRFDMFLGGKGFNQAVAAARRGAPTSMVGRLGDDDFGARFQAALEREGIDRTFVGLDAVAGTGVGLPLVEPSGENSIVIVPQANHAIDEAAIEAARSVIEQASVVLLQLELPLPATLAAARIADRSGATVILNPAPAPSSGADLAPFAGLVDVLVPNEVEAAQLLGIEADHAHHAEHADGDGAGTIEALARRYACDVVLTLGDQGALVLDRRGRTEHLPAHAVDVVDSVGAGDAFCGVLGAALARGIPLAEAAVEANAAAALAVTALGAEPSLPTAVALDAFLAAPRALQAIARPERP
jgi:ribokinase